MRDEHSPAFLLRHGEPLFETSRAVGAPPDPFSVIQTNEGYVCALGSSWSGCLPRRGRAGFSWSLHNDGNASYFFVGAASATVAAIDLVSDTGDEPASLADGIFWVHWSAPVSPDTFTSLHARFVVHYRDGRPLATLPIR